MTNEEAIFNLILMNNTAIQMVDNSDFPIATDMAIKALEQEPCNDWYDVPSDEMTLEQARQAVKDLRKKSAEYLEQEPCEDCVSREEVHNLIIPWLNDYLLDETREALETIDYKIGDLPSVTPQPKTRHWIVNKKVDTVYDISGYKSWAISYACEHCGFIHQAIENHGVYSYCPNCGARMVEPQESEVQE